MGWVILLAPCCIPFVPGLLLTLVLHSSYGRRGVWWAAGVGVGIALCFVILAAAFGWLTGSHDTNTECSDGCWDPPSAREITAFVVGSSFVLWLLGVGIGAAVSWSLASRRRRSVGS